MYIMDRLSFSMLCGILSHGWKKQSALMYAVSLVE